MRYAVPALLMLTATSALAQITPTTTVGDAASQVMQAAPAATSFGLGKVFNEADTNRDQVVTKEEFLLKAERHFGMADSNKDGKITRAEMEAQQAAFSQQMQQNLFGNGGWQGKLNQFLGHGGTTQAVPTTPVITAPSAPVVTPPASPTATTY